MLCARRVARMRRRRSSSGLLLGRHLLPWLSSLCEFLEFTFNFGCSYSNRFSSLGAGALALRLSVDTETILFAVQDIFTQGILGYFLLLAHDNAAGM
jgi:hypothetical protein